MALWRTTDPKHPSLVRYAEQRAASLQNRVADAITAFAGSMGFVYLHVIWFVLWLKVEPFKDVFSPSTHSSSRSICSMQLTRSAKSLR